jgi:hypothetical protein
VTLWAFIPGKHIEAIGSLPQSARNLHTGELVNDLPGAGFVWVRACGWWDLDNIDVPSLVAANHLTDAELAVLATERDAALAGRTQRRAFIDNARQAWATAKDTLQDYVDAIPPPPQVGDPGNPTLTLGLAEAQITYLYQHSQQLASIVIGIADVTMTLAEALEALIEQSSNIVLPT